MAGIPLKSFFKYISRSALSVVAKDGLSQCSGIVTLGPMVSESPECDFWINLFPNYTEIVISNKYFKVTIGHFVV